MSDYNRETSDYEPNFILKPAVPVNSDETKAGQPAEASTVSDAPSAVSKADKQAPASSESAANPADPKPADPESAADRWTSPDKMTYMFDQDFRDRLDEAEAEQMAQLEQAKEAARAKRAEEAAQAKRAEEAAQAKRAEEAAQAKRTEEAARAVREAQAAREEAARAMREAQAAGQAQAARPRYENPSFDPGQTGSYTDPRDKFRYGESASWSNGEVRRNKKAVKDSIRKQKKEARPVTLSRRALGLLIAGCLCLSCLTGLGGAAIGQSMFGSHPTGSAQTETAAASSGNSGTSNAGYTLENATGSSMTVKEITSAAKNSVVEIRTESVASDTWMQQYVTEGAGSGVIISDDGYIMTNNHVIEGASKIKVTTANEKEYDATLVGTDETNDVAVIKIEASNLTPATYGNSDQLEVGDMAVAIGNPLGELGGTVTAGIISATDRALSIDGKTLHLLQTDSSINPGNSGGGLFNGSGQLIGLVVAKSSGSDVEGLGFAIPINTAANVAQQLIDKGYVSGQPSTGMTYQQVTGGSGNDNFGSFDSFFGGGTTQSQVVIYSVNGDNAKKAGFQAGDIVTAVDGEEITSFDDLSSIITAHKVGDKLKFTIIRNGSEKEIKLTLEEKTASSGNSAAKDQDNQDQDSQNQQPDQDNQNGNGQNSQDVPDGQDSFGGNGGWQNWFGLFQ